MLLDMFSIYIALSSLRLVLKVRQPVAGRVSNRSEYLNSSTGSADGKLSQWENADFNIKGLWNRPVRFVEVQRIERVSATALNAVLGPAQYTKEQLQPHVLSNTFNTALHLGNPSAALRSSSSPTRTAPCRTVKTAYQAVSTTNSQASHSPPPVLPQYARRVGRISAQTQRSSLLLPIQVSQLGGATTSGKALDLGQGEPWEKAAHKLGLLPFPALSLKSTEASAKAYSPSFADVDTNMQPVRKKTRAAKKKAGADRSIDECSKPKQRKPRAKKTPVTAVQPEEEEVLAFSNESVLVIDSVEKATLVVQQLMGEYKDWDHRVHACDTEVGEIDVKKESPVGRLGRISNFSIYCGPSGNFGDGKSRLWVDVLHGGEDVLKVFKPYFEDPKVWHSYSSDKHILSRHVIPRVIHAQGFFQADTMYLALARLSDSARRGAKGGK